MGEVYRARDSRLAREVAIKVLPTAVTSDPHRRARFEREARLLAALNHPHIATVYGFEESGGTLALVMELVEGPTLAERLARGPLPRDESISTLLQIAEALEYAHDKGIIHRDLKPANVKLTSESQVKVLDFGLAKALETPASSVAQLPTLSFGSTLPGVIVGTAAYMAPEQAKSMPVDKRADIWAFGVVTFECLTGRRLFHGETPAETIGQVVTGAPDLSALPASTPPRLRELLRRCLVKDPKLRLRDIGEARILLLEPDAAPEITPPAAAPRPAGRGKVAWTAFAVAALAALVLTFALVRRQPAPAESVSTAIELPAGRDLGIDRGIAFSPDGRQLALTLVGQLAQRQQLFLRTLASSEVKPLAGTVGAAYPFWSPDGGSLGFFAAGKLKRIDLASGFVRTLCDAPDGRGAAWGAGGVIVFAPLPNGGLRQVAANGGTPVALDAPSGSASHRLPDFLPDGRRFLYLSTSNSKEADDGVFVFDLDTRKARRIRPGNSEARYVAPGYLAFVEDGTLMLQPFDAGDLRTTGDATPLVERVVFIPGRWHGDFSFSAQGALAYREDSQPLGRLALYDLSGHELKTIAGPDRYTELSLSPDARRALVGIYDEAGKSTGLWIFDLDRGVRSRFSHGAEYGGTWAPDGRRIAYFVKSGGSYRLMIAAVDGAAAPRTLLAGTSYLQSMSWSADGKTILVVFRKPGVPDYDVGILSLAGEPRLRPLLATRADESWGEISPDGKWLAYISDESGRREVYVTSFPNPGARWPMTNGGVIGASWRSLAEIVLLDPKGRLSIVPVTHRGGELAIGSPRLLSGIDVFGPATAVDVDLATKRSLRVIPIEELPPPRLNLIQNWAAGLKP